VSLSGKWRVAHSVTVTCHGWYAGGFRFDSQLANFRFVSFLYFFSGLGITFKGYC